MKIKITEVVIRHEGVEYLKDEVRTVPEPVGAYFCGNGWAEDADGKIETGARDVNRVTLAPDNVLAGHAAEKVGDNNG